MCYLCVGSDEVLGLAGSQLRVMRRLRVQQLVQRRSWHCKQPVGFVGMEACVVEEGLPFVHVGGGDVGRMACN